MKPDSLSADLEALRKTPGVHLQTLHMVDAVIDRHAGQRLTLGRGAAAAERLNIARCVSAAAETRPEAVMKIMNATGLSKVSAYRYLLLFEREAAEARKTRAGG